MKRRDFIKVSSAAGIMGLVGPGYDAFAATDATGKEGFDLHPFIKEHPEAVFINLTSVKTRVIQRLFMMPHTSLLMKCSLKRARGQVIRVQPELHVNPTGHAADIIVKIIYRKSVSILI